ncbi:MAG: hypothetical protein ACOH2R_26150 [Pseudomonas sp.]
MRPIIISALILAPLYSLRDFCFTRTYSTGNDHYQPLLKEFAWHLSAGNEDRFELNRDATVHHA